MMYLLTKKKANFFDRNHRNMIDFNFEEIETGKRNEWKQGMRINNLMITRKERRRGNENG